MRYKRKSTFRYTFDDPVPALFQITKINQTSVNSSQGQAKIVDISPVGVKIISHLDIPEINHSSIEINITFTLHNINLNFSGNIVRHYKKVSTNEYGVEFFENKEAQELLIKQLKLISKEKHNQDNR